MKASLNKYKLDEVTGNRKENENYIGAYIAEYKKSGFLNYISPGEYKDKLDAGEIIRIKQTSTKFEDYIISKWLEHRDDAENEYQILMDRLVSQRIRAVTKEECDAIKDILAETSEALVPYLYDFVLMYIFARKEIGYKKMVIDKHSSIISNDQKRQIENLYVDMSSEVGVTISDIIIYSPNSKDGKIVINSDLLIKMMMKGFGREYFSFIWGANEDNWDVMPFGKDEPRGRPIDYYKQELKTLLRTYLEFMEEQNIWTLTTTDKQKYFPIGRLLVMAGFPKWEDEKYDDEEDYYATILKNHLKR